MKEKKILSPPIHFISTLTYFFMGLRQLNKKNTQGYKNFVLCTIFSPWAATT